MTEKSVNFINRIYNFKFISCFSYDSMSIRISSYVIGDGLSIRLAEHGLRRRGDGRGLR